MSIYNFQPGPSKLPKPILKKVHSSIKEFKLTRKSILEISHRSKEFTEILDKVENNLRLLFDLPNNFQSLLIQGGATYQNTFISSNIEDSKKIACIVNGAWGRNTYEDFSKIRSSVSKLEFNNLHDIFNNRELKKYDFVSIHFHELKLRKYCQ